LKDLKGQFPDIQFKIEQFTFSSWVFGAKLRPWIYNEQSLYESL